MKAPQRARRSTACPATTTKIKKRPKPPKANKRRHFETLVLRYYSGVYRFASRLTDDPVEAVVLTHGAFVSTRKQLPSGRNEVEIVTILLTAIIRAARIVKLEGANRTTRVHADERVTESNRAGRQACSRRCPICFSGGKIDRGGLGRSRGPNAVSNAIGYAKRYSRSDHAVIRVYENTRERNY
jgi:hypothetical protein